MADKLTLRGMVDAINALSVPSVTRAYDTPPEQVSTADLPAMWAELPTIATNDRAINCIATTEDVTMGIVIAVEPYGQDTQAARFDLAIALGDELREVLTMIPNGTWDYSNWLNYSIETVANITLASSGYWGIRATLTASNSPL